ncbi:hypothetical protein Cch01nite_27750 [Cellulomonas chitinilytica]|uniref:DUF2510 domain-containing protein n=1 Tax=Cellulomonas chitinilytica TaxID=398759 RepID=A0A919P5L2_9CELL|nr:DUF2510 domain-containing protein [Cellulomonas chitinilytica]GIG22051.1 hypothetical protein Cch01nite_27750 [Cellulomonas chitinilytica]
MTQPQPPAGYYPDPSGAPQQRFWDGTAWTAQTQPFGPPTAVPTPSGPGTPPGFATPGAPAAAIGSLVGTLLTAAAEQAAHGRTAVQDRGVLGAGQDFYRGHQQTVDTVAGGALLAEGLVGLDKPGSDSRPGIFGALKGVGFGLLLAAISLGIALLSMPKDIPHAVSTSAKVIDVYTSSSTSGGRSCGIRAEYVVDGTTYQVSPGYTSSSLCSKGRGSYVDVKYDPADPGNAEVPESLGMRLIPWGMFALGLVITVVSAVRFVMRAAALGTGGWLLWRGLRSRATPQG